MTKKRIKKKLPRKIHKRMIIEVEEETR